MDGKKNIKKEHIYIYVCVCVFMQSKDLAIFEQSDVKTTVSKLMHEIMGNALAANYSFHGAHKKKAFEKLKLCDVISSKFNSF